MAAWQADVAVAGRYRLIERLGAGGVAEVWRAEDTVLRREVAVKLLLERLADDDETVTRFRREASTAAGISHPHAVVIYDVGEDRDVPFLVMELVDGLTLAAVLRSGPLDASVTAAIGHQIAGALGAAHQRGLVHRDVKPANVLLSPAGVAKLTDFGIATALGPAASRITDPGSVVGTAGYLAPEQLEAETVDARSDIYALGLVLHECLTGQPVFGEGTPTEIAARRLTQDAPTLRGLEAPAELLAAIMTATRREPADRFEDARAFARVLAPLVPEGIERRMARLSSGGGGTRPIQVEEPPTDRVATRVVHRDRAGGPGAETVVVPMAADTVAAPATAVVPTADERTEPPLGEPPPERPSFWRRNATMVIATLVVVAGLVAIGLAAGPGTNGDEPTADGGGGELAPIVSAQDVDPFGDRREHPDEVGAAYDGDASSDWSTERYAVADLGALKSGDRPGVGLLLDLGDVRSVRRLQLATATPGVTFSVYGWESLPDLADTATWGNPQVGVEGADRDVAIELDARGRYWMLWFTALAPDDGGFRARVNEVALLADR